MIRLSSGWITALIFAWTALAAAGLAAQAPSGNAAARAVKNPVPATAASIKTGAQLYQKNCSFCHGPAGKGDGKLAPKGTMPADLTDAKWERGASDGEIHATILGGTVASGGKMPGVKGRISDADVWHIVNYIRSLGPTTAAR